MLRDIITIDETKCTGCALCIPNCPEGALQIVEGKARLVSDRFCDGLGACLGECPEGAISVERREADAYDEEVVIDRIMSLGSEAVDAHLKHLANHGEEDLLRIAERGLARARAIDDRSAEPEKRHQWPVQLHLVPPTAPFFRDADVVLAADCAAYAAADFHDRYIGDRAFAIACPKLDSGLEEYRDKITAMIDGAAVRSLTVVMMQVPCCRGLLAIAISALKQAKRKVPVRSITLDVEGRVPAEEAIV